MEQCFLDNKCAWPSRVNDLARLHHCTGLDTYVTTTLEIELQCQLHVGILLAATVRELGVSVCLEQFKLTNDETVCDYNGSLPLTNIYPVQIASDYKTVELTAPFTNKHLDAANVTTIMQQCHAMDVCKESNDSEGNLSCLTSKTEYASTEDWDAELIEAPHFDCLPMMCQPCLNTEADLCDDAESWDDTVETGQENFDEPKVDSGVNVSRSNNRRDTRADFTWEASNPKKLFVNNISYRVSVMLK